MKREGIVFTLLVILLISISFVSAGLFGDAWNKITGRPIDENVTEEDVSDGEEVVCATDAKECLDGSYVSRNSDNNCEFDLCPEKECPTIIAWRIENNKCISDTGCDYDDSKYTYYGEEECKSKLEPDELPSDNKECEEGEMRYYGCPDGTQIPNCECENNMWVCKIFKDENCPNDGPEPETCASKIKVTFNKGSYQLGDDVKIIIETFDSQGNHVPNYAFYGQMYDNMWHSPDLQKTDNKGYLIHTGIAEKPSGGVTEVKFKVYTKETSSCGSVEDITEVKFEPGECGIGGCAPEPGCKDKVRMCGGKCNPCPEDDGEIFYPCSGCELEDKCYPYGFRKAESYCLDKNNMFANQLGDNAKCENNFECKTNLCINGNCVSSKLWNKFLGWFKKMFGGEDEEPGTGACSELLIEEDIGDYKYNQSLYGPKDMQVPVYSEDGTQMEIVKCCVAQYLPQDQSEKQAMGLVCQYDSKEEVKNSLRWIVAKDGNLDLGEYKGEKLIRDERNSIVIWISDTYIVASGGDPNQGGGLVEQVADAYLKRYSNDFDLTEEDIPVPPRPRNSVERCGEIEDSIEEAGCFIDVAISKSDVEICENIGISDRKDKCYINVAEHIGDESICEKVSDNDLKEKCYFWVAGETGESDTCIVIVDVDLQTRCYGEVAEKTGEAGYCAKMPDKHIADKCYRDLGIQTNNKALCNKIIEEQAKQKCLDNTS